MHHDTGPEDRCDVCQAPLDPAVHGLAGRSGQSVADRSSPPATPPSEPLDARSAPYASAPSQPLPIIGQGRFGQRPGLLLFLAFLAAGALATTVDCGLARWLATGPCPAPFWEMLEVCERFGNGLMVLVIALGFFLLDPARRWALPRLLAGPLLAGLAANLVKMSIMRIRPRHFDLAGDVWASFGSWFPLASAGSPGQSFPSGHTATAFGLAAVLGWLYPRGRVYFFCLAVLVAVQRMVAGAHFLSDVLVGAGLGVGLGIWFTGQRRWIGWLDRWQELPAAAGRLVWPRADRP